MRTITIYTRPHCVQCNFTTRWLDNHNIPYDTVDTSKDEKAADAARSLGHTQAPVVVVSNGDPETDLHWSGFQPDNLKRYCLPDAAA